MNPAVRNRYGPGQFRRVSGNTNHSPPDKQNMKTAISAGGQAGWAATVNSLMTAASRSGWSSGMSV